MVYRVSIHAVESYGLFYPGSNESVIVDATRAGLPISNSMALTMVGRRSPHPMHRGGYVLHSERTGLFVLSDAEQVGGWSEPVVTIITFLRFYAYKQYVLACRLYPEGLVPPTADATWIGLVVKGG